MNKERINKKGRCTETTQKKDKYRGPQRADVGTQRKDSRGNIGERNRVKTQTDDKEKEHTEGDHSSKEKAAVIEGTWRDKSKI